MGMKVMFHDIQEIKSDLNVQQVTLDQLLKISDYVSLHLPANDRTKHLISDREFGLMKPDAIIVNVSGGGLIDESALLRAVQGERIRGAAVDIFEKEPPDCFELIDHERIFPAPIWAQRPKKDRRGRAWTPSPFSKSSSMYSQSYPPHSVER
jgi:D-3-phosphoglycerate dehydrogenase